MEDPDRALTVVVESGGQGVAAVAAGAVSCLGRWVDCVRSAVTLPVVLVVRAAQPGDCVPEAPTLTDGRLRIPINVPVPLPKQASLARRIVLDLMVHGILEAVPLAPRRPPREVWMPEGGNDVVEFEPDLLPGELGGLKPNEVLVIVRMDDDREAARRQYDSIDERLAELVDQLLPGGCMADLFANQNTRNWIIATGPYPED